MNQPARDRVMKKFRDERLKILVATDVVGRGIDVTSISHIINFDTPEDCDDYVHRIGRTGRMGKEGVAYTFVSEDDGELLTRIEIRINQLLEQVYMEGMELKREVKQEVKPERLAAVAAMQSGSEEAPSEIINIANDSNLPLARRAKGSLLVCVLLLLGVLAGCESKETAVSDHASHPHLLLRRKTSLLTHLLSLEN